MFDYMKKLISLIAISILIWSCQKEPSACIEVLPSNSVTVFDDVTLKSCSEDAFWYEWEVEYFQNGAQLYQYSLEEEVNYSWTQAGTFDVYLTVQSENRKKQTSENARVTVTDVCYTCSNGNTSEDICYSNYDERSVFDAALVSFADDGFTCSQQ